MHYRAVIAYKNNGWGPFSWPSFKILDLVDCDDKEKRNVGNLYTCSSFNELEYC